MSTLTPEEQVLLSVHSGRDNSSKVARHTKLNVTQAYRLLLALERRGNITWTTGWSLTSAGYTRVQALQDGGVE